MLIKQKIKAFTMIELLITMTLTGILVVFAFMGYNQMQQLFTNYTIQNKFITDYNQLNKALNVFSNKSNIVEKTTNHSINFKTDSNDVIVELNPQNILIKLKSHTDTFHLKPQSITYDYIKISNDSVSNLIKQFSCVVLFQNQTFRLSFHKEYDASSILKSTLQLLPPDEQY